MSSLPPRVSAAPPGAPTGPPASADAGWATAGSGLAAAARDLATRIGRDIEGFKAGRVPWRSLQTLQRQAEALATRGVDDPAVERMLREQSQRIAQQGRALGDDGGWDAVELVKSSIRDAQAGRIGAAELERALALADTARARHESHWASRARVNLAQLEQAARTRTLPLLASRDDRAATGLREAQQAWQRTAAPAALDTLLERRTAAAGLLERNVVDPARRPALEAAVRAADVALARGRTEPVDAALERALRAWRESPDTARRTELNHRLAEARAVRRTGGLPQDTPAMIDAAAALVALPPMGTVRHRDIDPDRPGEGLRATYVGVRQADGSLLQTRVRSRETHVGDGRWEREFEAQGVSWRSADGRRYSERPGRIYPLRAADGGPLSTPAQAVARARELLRHGAIGMSDAPNAAAKLAGAATGRRDEGRFESQGVSLPGGLGRLGNRNLSELRGLLDRAVAPHAQRYLAGGNALIALRGTELENYVGVAMNLAPNVIPVRGGGPQSLFGGRPAEAIAPVADALRRAGGDAPKVRALPVYLRVDDTRMSAVPLFRVQGGDGRERLVDHGGRTYGSFREWTRSNALGAVDVFAPRGGRMTGEGGRVQFEAFDNRRFDNTALPVVRGGVAIVGAGFGIAALLGSGGQAAPIVLAGASAFSATDGGARLHDRAVHGQALSLADEDARMAWLDVGAGALGAGAIGTGSRLLGRASGVADLLQLGEGGRQFARDFGEMKPGERVLAGAQLAFWGAMLGVSVGHGAHSRFDLDALERAVDGAPRGRAAHDGGQAGAHDAGRAGARDGGQAGAHAGTAPTMAQARRASADAARQQFGDRGFANALHRAALRQAGDDPRALQRLIGDRPRMAALAEQTARGQLLERVFGGSRVPADVQRRFERSATDWASTQGGPRAARYEQLARPGAQRTALLREVVAEHLGGGSDALRGSLARELLGADESRLRALVTPVNGQPQHATVRVMQDALVERWSRDFGLDAPARSRLDGAVGERLRGRTTEAQRVELVSLASSDATRRALVGTAQRGAPAQAARTPAVDVAFAPLMPAAPAAPAAPAGLGPDGENAYGFVNLMSTNRGTGPVARVPALDPGSGYVGIVNSEPGRPVRIAWTPGTDARIDGAPAPQHAFTRHAPHRFQADWFFRGPSEHQAGFYAAYQTDGRVQLGIKSVQLNGTVTRIGDRTFPAAGRPNPLGGTSTPYFNDRQALDALAQLVADGTGRTVVIGPEVGPALKSRVGAEFAPRPIPEPQAAPAEARGPVLPPTGSGSDRGASSPRIGRDGPPEPVGMRDVGRPQPGALTETQARDLARDHIAADPRAFDATDLPRLAALLRSRGHVVHITERSPQAPPGPQAPAGPQPQRPAAAVVTPDFDGRASRPGVAYLSEAFSFTVPGAGESVTRAALDVARDLRQDLLGHATGASARDLYRGLDASPQRIEFTDVRLPDAEALRVELARTLADAGRSGPIHPPQTLPALRAALDAPDAPRALQRLADAARAVLNARTSDGSLAPLPGPDAAPPAGIAPTDWAAARDVLQLRDGLVRYDFRYRTGTPSAPERSASPASPAGPTGPGQRPAAPTPERSASLESSAATGPRTLANAFGFTNLVDVADVRTGDGLRSIERIPPLDPGSRYVGTIESVPGRAVRIAWTAHSQATANGLPVPGRAAAGQDAHASQAQRFFGGASPSTAGFVIEYGGAGTVLLRTEAPALNGSAARIGSREFASANASAARDVRGVATGGRIPDHEAVVELARYVARATGRRVVIGDPPIDGRPFPGILAPPAPARAPLAPEPAPVFGPRQAVNAFGVANLVRTPQGIRSTDALPPLPPDGVYQGVISSPRDGPVSIAWEPDAAVGRILASPPRQGTAPTRAERFFSGVGPAPAGNGTQGSVLAGFQATYSRDGTVTLGIRSPELNGAVRRIGQRELPPSAPAAGPPTPFFDDPAALLELAQLVADQTRRTVVIGPDVAPAQARVVGRELAPRPVPEPGPRPPLGKLSEPARLGAPVDWDRLTGARPLQGERRPVAYDLPAHPGDPDGSTRRVTVHAPDSMSDGELLTNATLQAIERPRSVDSPHAAARAARALDRAWVVEITRDGSIERGLASLRPDWNGRTAEPGTGHLGTVFASPPQPADVVGSREDLRGADRQATQAALDLGFGRLGQQSVVGSTTDAGMRNLYHAMDAPQQRIAFTDVRIDRKALIAAIGEIGDGRAPMASRPLIARALDAPDVDAALATLARSARDALNARSADGGLRPVLERAPGDASRQPPGTGEAAREVLGLPDGVVRYEFRFTRPPALTAVDPRAPLPARWGDAEALNAPVAAAPAAGAPGETRYWPPASGGENGRAEMSELELAKHVDEARTLLGAGVDPVQWGRGIRAWQRLDDGRFAVAVRHVPGEPLSSLSLPPAALREIGRQLEARIAGLRERGLQPTDLKPEHVRVTRTADGAIDSVRLIDPQLFPVRFASGWTPQSDDVLGPLLEGRHPLPPQASAPPRQGAATRSDPAPRTAGLATDAQRRDPEALRAAIEPARSDVQGLVVPVHPLQALPALRRALDPPDAVRGLQRLADAAGGALDARAQHDALGMRPGITPEAVPLVDVSAHDDPRRPKDPILTVWDRSQVFGRFRDPVSIKGAVGTAGSKLKPFQEGLVSQIEPVIPISGSTTFDPTAPDQVAVRQWLHDRGSGDPDRQPGRDPDSQEDEPDEGPPDRPVRPGERAPGAQRRSV